jgi:hypothetical protein
VSEDFLRIYFGNALEITGFRAFADQNLDSGGKAAVATLTWPVAVSDRMGADRGETRRLIIINILTTII